MSRKYASESELKRIDQFLIYDEATGEIKRVIFPNDMQIGLDAENFNSASFVVSGTVLARNGLTGSLTKLADGRSFIEAGSNVTVTSASNGAITIASTAGGSVAGSDTQVQFNDGGSFGGDPGLLYNKTSNSLYAAGTITASLGLTGSLTRLLDGSSFIEAGTNVTVTSASNGAITIAATAGSTNAAGSDTQIQYNNGGTNFGGIADLTWDDTDLMIGGSSSTTKLQFRDSGLYINSPADGKLTIESDGQLLIMSGGAPGSANEADGTDVSFFVSGAMGSKGTANKGTSLFGGDLAVSGTLHIMAPALDFQATDHAAILLDSTSASRIVWDSGVDSNAPDASIYESGGNLYLSGSGDVQIYAGTDDILLYPSDNVGINVSSPTHTLSVVGAISASLGLSGSLTRLVDGKSFIEAGSNVTVTSASNGAITIAATGGSTNAAGSDTQIQFNDGGTNFGGIADLTWDDTDLMIGGSSSTTKLQFRDSGLYINSPADGKLAISSDGQVLILSGGAPASENPADATDVNFFVSGTIGSKASAVKGTAVFGGDTVVSGTLTAGSSATAKPTARALDVYANVSGDFAAHIDNDAGSNAHGLKITSDGTGTGTTLLDVEAASTTVFKIRGDGRVGIGVATPGSTLSVDDEIAVGQNLIHRGDPDTYIGFPGTDQFQIAVGGVDILHVTEDDTQDMIVFNEGAADVDFRIESNNKAHAIFVDGGTDQVLILSGGAPGSPNEAAGTDVNFFVSGAIGTRTTATTGSALFGGDLVSSGSVYGLMGLSGSLTKLTDGSSFIEAGSNITVTSASNGAITITSAAGGISFDGSTVDGLLTYKDSDEATVEENLRFNGSALHLTGALNVKYVSKTSDYSVAATDYIVGVNTSGGPVTASLPAAATAGAGRLLIVKDIGGFASASDKAVVIEPNGSEKIDGADVVKIIASSGSVSLFGDGSNWYVNGVS